MAPNQQKVLAQHLAMNRQSWAALQQHGVTEESELRLDFFYAAADEEAASRLAQFLEAETDYEVMPRSSGGGFLRKQKWTISGTTQPTKVSSAILDQWVEWMVAAGFQFGCEFDGWGAESPG